MKLTLNVKKRGTLKPNQMRRQGLLPAVIYGPDLAEPKVLELNAKEFQQIFKEAGETQIIEATEGKLTWPVLVHNYQRDPISAMISHVDLLVVSQNRKIVTHIPLHFSGLAPAVKSLGGVLITNLRQIEVEAIPGTIPARLEVDLGGLVAFHDEILVGDLPIPEGVEVLTEVHLSVVSVLPPRTQAEIESLDEVVEERVEDVGADKVGKIEEDEAGEGDAKDTKDADTTTNTNSGTAGKAPAKKA